jgi:hypothetical protein
MNERLDFILAQYPESVNNQNKYRDLMKECSQLGEIAAA